MAKDYKDTLNLPTTDFPMRANLPAKEPETLKKWEDMDLYGKMLSNNDQKPMFILHDGPPFSNGNIHMGHALNKILKDIINKSKSMSGYKVPFIAGWDNHGMPIESAIIKKSKLDRKRMSIPEFRSKCQEFAQNFVDLQMTSFKRLGITADWDNSYLTMKPSFESKEIKIFGEMYKKGYIYKSLKPVYWCAHDETALAEAEIEYKDDKCTSIYVKFAVKDDRGLLGDISNTYFIIWTTTPWTLPGNLAIAVHPREEYSLIKAANGEKYIIASALCEKTMKFGKIETYEVIKTFKGSELEYIKAAHPFLDRDSVVVNADYVTMDSGTGCVHTAPGFGADDYHTGMRYKLPIIVPVDDKGFQTEEAGKFAGMRYDASNSAILEDMRESGALFASEELSHSYPHCWRCGNPIIFRATPQWFCSVDKFRDDAVEACTKVEWMPKWGGERIVSMIKERADWCISRQRHWGLPIPVFYCKDCGEVICTPETIDKISKIYAEKGSNSWFDMTAEELLPNEFVCPKCKKNHFEKETDTLDGWFDSGCTHFEVLFDNPELQWPADLYLEGGDQYRGWFQSSLLTAVATKNQGAPYKAVLTNGWTVDGEGKAMHKSLGNSVAPEDIIKLYGADIVRLWVAASD
ncbi:MAG: isoleucine--tRNA ligase, partial [Clostridia bacterium]